MERMTSIETEPQKGDVLYRNDRNPNIAGKAAHMILLVFVLSLTLAGSSHVSAGNSGHLPLSVSPEIGGNSTLQGPFQSAAGLTGGKLLVAGRNIRDPRFYQTVILLITHDQQGSTGCIINRPIMVKLSDALPDLHELRERTEPVFFGGPVAVDRIQVLFRSKARHDKSLRVFDNVFFSVSPETLVRIILGEDKDEKFRVYAGYSGWASGQLRREVMRGDWYILRADPETVFHEDPSLVWPEMMRRVSGQQWVRNQYLKLKETAREDPREALFWNE